MNGHCWQCTGGRYAKLIHALREGRAACDTVALRHGKRVGHVVSIYWAAKKRGCLGDVPEVKKQPRVKATLPPPPFNPWRLPPIGAVQVRTR